MIRRLSPLVIAVALLAVAVAWGAVAQAATGPIYDVKATWGDTNLPPGGAGQFAIQVRNIGDAPGAEEALSITDHLPAGVTATHFFWTTNNAPTNGTLSSDCSGLGTGTVNCVLPAALVPELAPAPARSAGFLSPPSGALPTVYVDVAIAPGATGSATNTASVQGGGAPAPAGDEDEVPFDSSPAPFGVVGGSFLADVFDAAYPFGAPTRQASDHPFELRVDFDLAARSGVNEDPDDTSRYITSTGQLRTVEVALPRGIIGNPEATPKCKAADFAEAGASASSTACPANTQVGYLNALVAEGVHNYGRGSAGPNNVGGLLNRVALYNLVPPKGVLSDLGFNAGGLVQAHLYTTLDPLHGYSLKTTVPNVSSLVTVRGSEATVWGVPGDPAHDRFRTYPHTPPNGDVLGAPWGSAAIRPFLTNPMDCGEDNGGSRVRLDSYNHPGQFSPTVEYGQHLNVNGCGDPRFRFEPEVSMTPTSKDAGGPTGLDVNLKIPQRNDEVEDAGDLYAANGSVKAIATSPLKRVVVKLPEGMTVSPSGAQGLSACTPAQIGIDPVTGIPNEAPVRCPEASQYGTMRLKSPALPQGKAIEGRVYVAQPYTNPFHSFLALYLAIEDEDLGLQVKLAGEVKLDPRTGRITTEFDGLPQQPTSEVEIKVKGGLRAGLVNPQTCGQKTIEATFYSWQDPGTPHTVKSSYDITQGPGGTPCFNNLSERPFDPRLQAETLNPLAGAFSPLFLRLTREDTDQDLAAVQGTAPPGLLASLRGITRCSDAQIAAAANPARTGTEELDSPSCPASSQVGTVEAGAGVGQILTYVTGKVYLAGPYKGAPLSGVAIVPAVAGPFDLGTVVTRAPAYLDPETAQLRIATDPLPQIFKGVPVRVRDIRVQLDRTDFTLNPTSCEEMHIAAGLQSSEGKSKNESNRFQVGSCGDLGFEPRLSLKLKDGSKRGDHPSLRAELRARAGDANIASAAVALPHSAFLDQAHIRTICTRVQFAAKACPAGSIYGHARAFTPLLDDPLEGQVYLRSSNHNLPDLVVSLHGPSSLPIEFNLDGRVDSVHGGIRTTFAAAPDAPVSKFVLTMQGGKKGLIVSSADLCAATHRASARLVAHNGRRHSFRPKLVAADCWGQGRHKRHAK